MTSALLLAGGKTLLVGNLALLLGSAPSGAGGGSSGLTSIALQGGGQSNAVYANDTDGALIAMAQALAFYLGATSYAQQSSNGATDIGGAGSYEDIAGYAYFLTNTEGLTAEAASTAALSANGELYINFLTALASPQRAAIEAIIWYWGETDSVTYAQATKPVPKAALINLADQVRAAIGKTNAELPLILFGPPYGSGNGPMTMREIWAELAADPAQNAVWAVQQTYDTISRNETFNATTGIASGGNTDGGHRAAIDNVALYKRGAIAVARTILAANSLSAGLIPSSLGLALDRRSRPPRSPARR